MTDLVERLRETGSDLADDAADEIERLTGLLKMKENIVVAMATKDAEIERLRAALTRLTTDITSSAAAMDAVSLSIFEDALAALGEKP